jgi:trimethylamine--corrinoid protein Co-methyltransferase
MHASLLGYCLESLLIDNDIIGSVQRTIKGIEVTDESIAMETIRQTCLEGPGHYLGADQTLRLMQTEYVYPLVGDRTTPKEWVERGRPGIVDRAIRKTRHILDNHFPAHIATTVDDSIRQRFPVRLARDAMRRAAAAAE